MIQNQVQNLSWTGPKKIGCCTRWRLRGQFFSRLATSFCPYFLCSWPPIITGDVSFRIADGEGLFVQFAHCSFPLGCFARHVRYGVILGAYRPPVLQSVESGAPSGGHDQIPARRYWGAIAGASKAMEEMKGV